MESKQTLRIGIAGAGAFAAFLAEALAPLSEFQLTAVAGRTPAKRQRVIEAYRALRPLDPDPQEYAQAESLIDEADVDVVIVATPPDTQAELSARVLSRGRHLFLEKPGALSAEALAANVHLAASGQRAIVIDLVMRHNPIMEAVAQICRKGWLGCAEQASLVNAAHRVIGDGHWFWDKTRSGGILVEHGVHFFEVGRHWFGEAAAQRGGAAVESTGEESRVWATVLHKDGAGHTVPVTYYHGFTRDADVPEITRWAVIFQRGRVMVEGWVAQTLTIEGMLSPAEAQALNQLLDAIPVQPDPAAAYIVRRAAAELADAVTLANGSDSASSGAGTERTVYRRTVELPDRQGWYKAMVQGRLLDLRAMCLDPNQAGLITPQDAVRDLAIAEACSVESDA